MLRRLQLLSSVSVFLLTAAGASQVRPPAHAAQTFRIRGVALDAERADGSVWALTERYKAGFDTRGARFVPFFGAAASRSWPLDLELAEIRFGGMEGVAWSPGRAVPRASGGGEAARVVYARGLADEVYELTESTLEQRFVLHERLHTGDIVVRIRVRTELEAQGHESGTGLVFASRDGRMAYGDCVAIDARGARIAFASRLDGDSIELRVPAAFADEARFPLLIDPVLQSLTVASSNTTMHDSDVAYSPLQNVWDIVYQRDFANGDSDVLATRIDSAGRIVHTRPVAATANEEFLPAVAIVSGRASVDRFVYAWIEKLSSSTFLELRERAADASAFSAVTHADNGGNLGQRPGRIALGGSVSATRNHGRCLIAYEFASSLNQEVRAKVFTTGASAGAVGPLLVLDKSPGCTPRVTVNRCSVRTERWLIAWGSTGLAPGCRPQNIFAASVTGDSSLANAATQLTNGKSEHSPSVTGDGDRFFMTWIADELGNDDVLGALVKRLPTGPLHVALTKNLTRLEPGANVNATQVTPVVDFDGCRYACSYVDSGRVFAMAFGITPDDKTIVFAEGHVPLGTASSNAQFAPAIAACGGAESAPSTFLVTWTENRGIAGIEASRYAARGNQAAQTIKASCTTKPAALILGGPPALGLPLAVAMKGAAGAPLLSFGFLRTIQVPLCTTAFGTCGIGVDPIVMLAGHTFSATIPRDIRLAGGRFAFQGFDVLAPGGCPANVIGVPFATTDILTVTIQ